MAFCSASAAFRRPCFSGSAQARPKDNERGKEDHRNDKNIRQQTLAEAAFFFRFLERSPRPRRDFPHGRDVRGARFSFPVRDAPDEQASLPARGVPDVRVCPPARTLAADRLVLLRGTLAADRLTILRGTFPTDGFSSLTGRSRRTGAAFSARGALLRMEAGASKLSSGMGAGASKLSAGTGGGGLFRQRLRRVRSHALGGLRNIKSSSSSRTEECARRAAGAFRSSGSCRIQVFMLSHSCPQFKMRMAVDIWRMPMMFEPRVICSPL